MFPSESADDDLAAGIVFALGLFFLGIEGAELRGDFRLLLIQFCAFVLWRGFWHGGSLFAD